MNSLHLNLFIEYKKYWKLCQQIFQLIKLNKIVVVKKVKYQIFILLQIGWLKTQAIILFLYDNIVKSFLITGLQSQKIKKAL